MMGKLRQFPTAHRLIPFVKASYGQTSQYTWRDDENQLHVIQQGEGGEQGDALMPALFALGLHDALEEASRECLRDETVLAYLDDVYILSSRGRARYLYDVTTDAIRRHSGIEPNKGKTECWSLAGGDAPPGIQALNPPAPAEPVWKGNLAMHKQGLESSWLVNWSSCVY